MGGHRQAPLPPFSHSSRTQIIQQLDSAGRNGHNETNYRQLGPIATNKRSCFYIHLAGELSLQFGIFVFYLS